MDVREKGAMPYAAPPAARAQQQQRPRPLWAKLLIASLQVYLLFAAAQYFVSDILYSPGNRRSPAPLIWDYDASKAPLGEIDWHQCGPAINASIFECGHLSAPLDHLRPEDTRRASIYIARHKARNPETGELTPRDEVLGTILLNPGGPGGSGVDFLTKPRPTANNQTTGDRFNKLTEGKYDYLSFDPRGVGRSWPRADCFPTAADSCATEAARTVTGMYHALPGGEAAQAGAILADFRLTSQLCSTKNETRELLRYVGTTHTARDMRLMYTAVGDKGLNYWGFSYGTVLGAAFADMFPDEVQRLAIDGVVNSIDYWTGEWDSTLTDTDKVLQGFFRECASSGKACALTKGLLDKKKNSDEKQVEMAVGKKVDDVLHRLAIMPMVAANATHPGVLTWSEVKSAVFQALYSPSTWNALAKGLQAAYEGSPIPLFEKNGLFPCDLTPKPSDAPRSDEANSAIACGDVNKRFKHHPTAEDYKRFAEKQERKSAYFGGVFEQGIRCKGEWPQSLLASETWRGNFTSHTKNPLLILSVEYDPVTPHANGIFMTKRFPNSSSALRRGYGHCTIAQKSRCMEKVVRDYFVDGKEPKQDTVCDWDKKTQPIFYGDEDPPTLLMHAQAEKAEDLDLSFAAEDIASFSLGRRLL